MSLIKRIFRVSNKMDLNMVKDLVVTSIENVFNCKITYTIQSMNYKDGSLDKVCIDTDSSIVVGENHYMFRVDLHMSGITPTMAFLIIQVYSGKDIQTANFYIVCDGTAWSDVICAINDTYVKIIKGDENK